MFRSTCFALLLATLPPLVHAADPITVYGVALGQPLALAECQTTMTVDLRDKGPRRRLIPKYANRYFSTNDEMCFVYLDERLIGTTPSDAKFRVAAPTDAQPPLGMITGRIIDGVVAHIEIRTRGMKSQEADLATLSAKFGEPNRSTLVGDLYRYANWELGDGVRAHFSGATTDPRFGRFALSTPAGAEANQRDEAEAFRRIPEL